MAPHPVNFRARQKVDRVLTWFIPPRCVLCNQATLPDARVCEACRADLPWLLHGCRGCGFALPAGITGFCARCVSARVAFRVRSPLAYEFPVNRMVTGAKFRRQLHFAWALGELLASAIEPDLADARPDVLVPMPLHRRRLAERGYNQSAEIARPLIERLGLVCASDLCLRVKATSEQSGLTAIERRRNLRGAFRVQGRCEGMRVAVVDDVITTGSTAAAISVVLREAGAAQVQIWAVARTSAGTATAIRS